MSNFNLMKIKAIRILKMMEALIQVLIHLIIDDLKKEHFYIILYVFIYNIYILISKKVKINKS